MTNKSTTDIDRVVGLRITALRQAQGMTQTVLGQALGVTFQQVQKYERGKNRVSSSRVQQIAQLFEVPISALFGEDEPASQSDAFEFLTPPGAVHLLQAYIAIDNDELRRQVLQLVRTAGRIGAGSVTAAE